MEDCLLKRGESLMEDFSGKNHVFGGRDPHAWLHLNRQSSLQAQDLFGEKDPRGCRILGGKGIRFWLLFGHHTHHKWTGRESLEAVTQPYEKKQKSLLDFFFDVPPQIPSYSPHTTHQESLHGQHFLGEGQLHIV